MLVLSRRTNEVLTLTLPDGRTIEVRVLSGGPVRLGITAPVDVNVERTQ
jgi:carbon storage regulator CsrA